MRVRALALLVILALAAGAARAEDAPASSSGGGGLGDAVDKTKAGLEKAANFTSSAVGDVKGALNTTVSEVKEAFNATKAGVNRILDYLKTEPQIAETSRLAAKPSAAVMAGWASTTDAVNAAQAGVAGTTGTVGDAAVAYDGAAAAGAATPRSSDIDVFSAGELGAAAATGSLQNLADGILAATAAGGADKLSASVGKVVGASPNATVEGAAEGERPPSANLGAAFGLAMREAPAAYVNRVGAPGVPLRVNASAVADTFVAGLQEAAIPCAATAGDSKDGADKEWFAAAAAKCCPVVNPALRGAQAAVEGDPGATRALYVSLSNSFTLGGRGSFNLGRCSTADAKA